MAPTMLSLAKEKTLLEKKLANSAKNSLDDIIDIAIEEVDNDVEHIESHKGPCTPPNLHESLDLAKGPQTPEGNTHFFKGFMKLQDVSFHIGIFEKGL